MLGRVPGVAVVEAGDAATLARHLAGGNLAAVVTEHRPPWADAVAILAAVKGSDAPCPVVLFTAAWDARLLGDAVRGGLDGFVAKDSAGFLRLPEVVGELVAGSAWGRDRGSRRVVDGLPIGVFTAGPGAILTGANPALARLLGVASPGLLVGLPLADSVDDEEVAAQLRGGETVSGAEVRLLRPDGGEALATVDAWPDEDRGLAGCVADLAPARAARERMERRVAALERSNAELEQFASVVSHDLQEPLHLVERFARMLAERYGSQVGDEGRSFLKHVVAGAERMQAMVDAALAYSRIGTRGRPFAPVDLESALSQAVDNLKVTLTEAGASVTHGDLPTLPGDEAQLVQLLQNLVGNAVKFRSSAPPEVYVSAEQNGDGWDLVVRDNGIGIPPEHHDRIFLMFQRLHTEDEIPGNGIGLAICKRIAERHGGGITVESEPGRGSRFRVRLAPHSEETRTAPDEERGDA